ncbi:MAG: hypothetical protein II793_04200, partial [Bacteroidales bacterium]|nr:hypothetical protein [Bacteroidales bacterium]
MKRLLSFVLLCATLFVMGTVMAQAPQRVSYQAVVRHANNRLAAGETMDVRISILQGSAEGQAVYVESRQVTTNANGLFTIVVGNGDNLSGHEFADINWAEGPYFLKSEVDAEGDQTYSAVSVSQVISVPYALHANTASSLIGLTDSLNAIRTKVTSDMQIGRIHTENAVNALSDEILALRTVIDDTVLFITEYIDEAFVAIRTLDEKVDSIDIATNAALQSLRDAIDTNRVHDSINMTRLHNDILNTQNVHDGDINALRTLIDSIDMAKQDTIDRVAAILAAEIANVNAINRNFNDTVSYLQDTINKVAANLATEVATRTAAVAIFNDTVAYLQDTIDNVAANLAAEVATRETAVAIFNDTVAYLQDTIDNVAANLA